VLRMERAGKGRVHGECPVKEEMPKTATLVEVHTRWPLKKTAVTDRLGFRPKARSLEAIPSVEEEVEWYLAVGCHTDP